MGFGDERGDGGYRGAPERPGMEAVRRRAEEAKRRKAEQDAATRRTRLHYFGLAGGRR